MNTEHLLFNIFNFVVFVTAGYILLRPVFRQFFFARRIKAKKGIAASMGALGKAKYSFRKMQKTMLSLPTECEARKKMIMHTSTKECESIIIEANRQKERIVELANKRSESERTLFRKSLRTRMLEDAFTIAKEKLVKRAIEKDFSELFVTKGIDGLKKSLGS